MKKLLFAGIAVSMLAACSQDEVVPVNNDSNAIKFGVVTENGTRAEDIYCTNNPFANFQVFAKYGDAKYIDGDLIVKNGSNWDNNSGLRYWPNSGSLTFYAHRNGDKVFTWGEATDVPTFKEFKVEEKVNEQLDLMYAVKTESKTAEGKVTLNFRHALSQIVFNAKNTNENLYVEIDGVSVVNVNSKGTYTFPTGDTDNTLTHPDASGTEKNGSRGTWFKLDEDGNVTTESTLSELAQYNVTFNTVKLIGSGKEADDTDPVHLTSYDNDEGEGETPANFANAMILLPQTTTGFDLSKNIKNDNGSYFLVKCKIWNVADGEYDKENGIGDNYVLWGEDGEDGFKNIMIPVSLAWEEGKKYTYTFIFGQGNGGYDPDPEDPDTPDPVLVPITFNVTIDEFINVTPSIDVPMDKPTTPTEGENTGNGGENTENNEGGENA